MTTEQIERTKALVEALRSGNYKQCSSHLKRDVDGHIRHCCLGVGSEIAGCQNEKREDGIYTFGYPILVNESRLPSVQWWKEYYGWDYNTRIHDLWNAFDMNDNGLSFNMIADAIEKVILS